MGICWIPAQSYVTWFWLYLILQLWSCEWFLWHLSHWNWYWYKYIFFVICSIETVEAAWSGFNGIDQNWRMGVTGTWYPHSKSVTGTLTEKVLQVPSQKKCYRYPHSKSVTGTLTEKVSAKNSWGSQQGQWPAYRKILKNLLGQCYCEETSSQTQKLTEWWPSHS